MTGIQVHFVYSAPCVGFSVRPGERTDGMKNKYALTIADIQLDVLSEAPREEVDKISGIVDRKMREIYLHSRSCTRNEAALLCALEFCAERLENQGRLTELEQLAEKYDEVLKAFRDKNHELSDEVSKLRGENELLRSLLTDKERDGGAKDESAPVQTSAANPVSAKEFLRQVADAQYADGGNREEKEKEEKKKPAAQPEAAAVGETASRERRRTGGMFDLLSFDDV